MTVKQRVDRLIKEWLMPELAGDGFRRKGRVFYSHRAEVTWVIDIQSSKIREKGCSDFTLNWGVFIEGVMSAYITVPYEDRISIPSCCFYDRVTALGPKKGDRWWKFTENDDASVVDPKAGEEIVGLLSSYALQFLRQFETKREVAEFLIDVPDSAKYVFPRSDITRSTYAAIIYSLIGDVEKQKGLMKRAYDASRGAPGEEEVEELYRKFG